MSHFSLLVALPEKPTEDSIDAALRPFQEYDGDAYDEYAVHVDVLEKESQKEISCVKFADGLIVSKYDDGDYEDVLWAKTEGEGWKFMLPEGANECKARNAEVPGFAKRLIEYYGAKKVVDPRRVPAVGSYVLVDESEKLVLDAKHYTNPNGKWDWYVIGGRYSDRLLTNHSSGDSAQKGAVLWEKMRKRNVFEFREGLVKSLERTNLSLNEAMDRWRLYVETNEKSHAEYEASGIDKYKDWLATLPKTHPAVVVMDSDILSAWGYFGMGVPDDQPDPFAYGDSLPAFVCYAHLIDGKWTERGEVLPFGISVDNQNREKWKTMFEQALKGIPDDHWIVVVDCHS